MSKAHRGKGIRETFARGRGLCAVCGKDRIKTVYEQEIGGEKKMICKFCKAAIKNGKTV
jgi:CRISPR/Cas system-associated protein Cas10 (large subunit of type III CRISPR-Cas system)